MARRGGGVARAGGSGDDVRSEGTPPCGSRAAHVRDALARLGGGGGGGGPCPEGLAVRSRTLRRAKKKRGGGEG